MVAFEFRDRVWFAEETYAVMRLHNAALCIAESDDLQTPEVQCARTHACYRLRRSGGYTEPTTLPISRKDSPRSPQTRDVFVYFKHEDEPTGALNAVALLDSLRRQGREAMSDTEAVGQPSDDCQAIDESRL